MNSYDAATWPEALAEFPLMCRERPEFRLPLRVHHHGRRYIVYIAKPDHVLIYRLLRDESDLARRFGKLK